MKLSKTFLLLPAASLLIAAAIGSGACSSSVSISTSVPTIFPTGIAPGGVCSGDIYFQDGDGYVACVGSVWVAEDDAWFADLPAGYSVDPSYSDGYSVGDTGTDTGTDGSTDTGTDGSTDTGTDGSTDTGTDGSDGSTDTAGGSDTSSG